MTERARIRVGWWLSVVVLGFMLAEPVGRAQSVSSSADSAPIQQKPTPGVAGGKRDESELANQVNNPAAPVTLLQFRNVLLPDVRGTNGATNEFQIQPVLPFGPFASFPVLQLMKITMPFPTLPSPMSAGGVGDLQVFDLVSIKQSWGRWGLGGAFVFPTASSEALGQGKWQAGPAVAAIYSGIKNLSAGAVFQNPISYAGDSARPAVNQLIITPTFTYTIKHGWFAGLSDYNLTFDWKKDGAATVPLGVQFGRVFHIGTQAISMSMEVGGAAATPSGTPSPGWILGFEFSPIFKGHIQ